MRDLKFRAWDSDNNEMFNPKKLEWNAQGELRFFNKNSMWAHSMVLMQYTGLKDNKGKEIYEGDVVTYGTEDEIVNAIVEFAEEDSETSMFLTGFKMVVFSSADYEDGDDSDHALEIIGNIYENPEFLV